MREVDLYEVENLLHEISRFKKSDNQVSRIQELLQPIFDNERAKEERDKRKLSTSYMKYNVEKEISRAVNALTGIRTLFKLATEDLKRLHGEEQDILHALELTDLSMDELVEITGELKQVRIMRRVAKNFLESAQALNDFAEDNDKLAKQLQGVAGVTRKTVGTIERRRYTVREKTTLQEAFENAGPFMNRVGEQS